MPEAPATILGGLPVVADVSFGVTDCPTTGRDYWSEVDAIYWRRRDGSKGKPISQKIWDKAEKADPYFCSVIEQVNDHLVHEQDAGKPQAVATLSLIGT